MNKRQNKPIKNLHLRNKDSVFYCERNIPLEFRVFVEKEIWPSLTSLHSGYKQDQKRETATYCLHNLIESGLTGKVVADYRDNNKPGIRHRKEVWDAIIESGLCRICKGSEESGRVSLYEASNKLLNLRQKWELKLLEIIDLKRNSDEICPTRLALVVLYSGKTHWLTGQTLPEEEQKKPLSIRQRIETTAQPDPQDLRKPCPQAVQNGLDYIRQIESSINEINEENLKHSFIAYAPNPETGRQNAFNPNVLLRQVHSGGLLFQCVRLYSWGALSGQGLSQAQREKMTIDGQRVAEIDSHCHAIRCAYHLSGIDERGDVYWCDKIFPKYLKFENVSPDNRKIVRDFVKTSTNICLNTSSKIAASKAISTLLRENRNRTFLQKILTEIENTDIKGFLDRVVNVHPEKVQNKFFCDFGLELMTTESKVMHHTLREFVVHWKKPALAIHDSLLVRASDVKKAGEIYSEMYQKFMLFKPVLRQKF